MSDTNKDFLKELNLRDLGKRLKSNIGEIKGTLNDIEKLLKPAERLLQELIQDGITNEELFFNVAPPAAPADAPPAVTPTPIVQIIAKDIARIARQIRIRQMELEEQINLAVILLIALRSVELNPEEELSVFSSFFAAVGRIETIRMELQSLRDELEADVTLLLGIAGEL